ncbi:MAG: UDP-N-acetylmuramoyl-L-alanine--D-glutamate ligase [Spirochaetota bacterium]
MKRFSGARVTVLGLGLHGGGVETVRYLHRHGATVTVTDLRSEAELRPSLDLIGNIAEKIVLGRHDPVDFTNSDFVVKNPAVPRHAPILGHAREIRSDISLFFERWSGPCIAVTGSKGKSTVSSMIHHALLSFDSRSRLGGNITVSPLSFVDEISPDTPVVLELSSFQLGDLNLVASSGAPVKFAPHVSVITNIFKDHQDYYQGNMEDYVRDKERIFETMPSDGTLVLGSDDSWADRFERSATVPTLRASKQVVQGTPLATGTPLEINRGIALTALTAFGVDPLRAEQALSDFRGIEHRFETVYDNGSLIVINDSASTVPEAALAAVRAAGNRTVLITGGTDKRLDIAPFRLVAASVDHFVLLEGSATRRIQALLDSMSVPYAGPYRNLSHAFRRALELCRESDSRCILFSPGCASFELFANEFDRGRQFKKLVESFQNDLH